MIKINNVELEEIDMLDADTMEMVEDIINNVEAESDRISKMKSLSEMIREQCNYVAECFDKLFGEGTGDLIFDGKQNMRVAISSFEELMNYISSQREETEKEFSKYSPNRAARRSRK